MKGQRSCIQNADTHTTAHAWKIQHMIESNVLDAEFRAIDEPDEFGCELCEGGVQRRCTMLAFNTSTNP